MRFYTIYVFFLLGFGACQTEKAAEKLDLVGRWQAFALYQGDTLSDIDVSTVSLELSKFERFIYTNNLNEIQAGTYFIKDSLLITTDTMVSPNRETAVQIMQATKDSLTIRMNLNNQEALFYFKRK